ncbi:MAG: hypothetical protein H0W67_09305 [Gemmatimonadales bacterium]|nr:hypothetical protein [Gemmatimonadales bacterium]
MLQTAKDLAPTTINRETETTILPPSVTAHSTRRESGGDEGEEEISYLGLLNAVLRARRLVFGMAVASALIVVGISLFLPRSYTADSSFMPQSRKQGSGLSGLAAQFGLAVPAMTEGGQSPAFYADLLESHAILGQVVDTRFEYRSDTGTVQGTLIDLYRSKGETPALRRDAAIRRLEGDLSTSTVQKTGVVELSVMARHPALAVQISQRLLDLLNRFNLQTRQSQAAAERRFTEARLGGVRRDLRAAEDRAQAFLQRNRDYRNSPELTFQQDRLQREVSMQQELFTTLAQAFEQAKIEEVRDTPVITLVQQPELPVRPDRRGIVAKGIMAGVLGGLLGIAIAIARAYTRNSDLLETPAGAEFDALRRETMDDLTRPLRPFRRTGSGSARDPDTR